MNHKGTVTLETKRLILRRFTMDDLEPMFRNCWNDPEVWKWTSYEPMKSIDDVVSKAEMFTDKWLGAYERANRYSWAIQLKDTGEVIGRMFGMNPDDRAQQIELAYEFGRNWWNHGYATEVVRKMIEFFFSEVGFYRIYANHADKNPASGRVMLKCDMIFEGISRRGLVCNAGRFDALNYAILAEDYFKTKSLNCSAIENY